MPISSKKQTTTKKSQAKKSILITKIIPAANKILKNHPQMKRTAAISKASAQYRAGKL